MGTRRRGFTLLELLIALGLLVVLNVVLMATLTQVSKLWGRSNSRDDAIRQLLRVKTEIVRDLSNSSRQNGQWASAQLPPAPPLAGLQGDALTFLSSDNGTGGPEWSTGTDGQATPQAEITYFLAIPNAPNSLGITCQSGPPDGNGYEQQDPFKWLMRKVVPPPGGSPNVIDPLWQDAWVPAPSHATTTLQIVADQMLQFRVLSRAPMWRIEIRAVAIGEASRKLALGSVPLARSAFTLVEQFTVTARN